MFKPGEMTLAKYILMLSGEVYNERSRQIEMFPAEETSLNGKDGTGGSGRDTYMRIAKLACDREQRDGYLTHAHIFEEESAEVLAETEPVKLRKELIEVMAVCAKWIQDIDRRFADEKAALMHKPEEGKAT